MGQQSLIYSFVARGTVILAEYTEVTGNFTSIASQCLQKLPASNNKFTYNCDNHTFNYLVEDGYTYCVVAVESVGRQIPVAFLERIKEDFTKRYGGGKAATAVANSLNREFGPKLKEDMQYCVDHPEEISKLAKVKAQVSEVKGVMMENIEKVLDRGETIELLVDKIENLRSQVFSSELGNTTQEISVVRKVMEEDAPGEGEADKVLEVAPALISVHPLDNSVVVAVGSELRIFDLKGNSVISLSEDVNGPPHSDAIRGICFSANGRLFASGGDDKLVKIWRTDTWHCVRTVYSEKRVSAVAISHDGLFVTFADKFGVVWLEGLQQDGQNQGLIGRKAVPLLGHYCSIITDLKFSPDRKFIASADRDFKIRITIFPQRPTKGAHEIQSFCLGHTDFVSCLAFICPPGFPQSLLLSGSGDATVRLWDHVSGCLLDSFDIGTTVGFVDSNDRTDGSLVVTDINAFPDGTLIAVAVQGLHGLVILKFDVEDRTLSISKIVSLGENFVPTSLGLSSSSKQLWMIMGVSNACKSGVSPLVRVRVLSDLGKLISDECGDYPVILEDREVPGGEKMLLKLQGSLNVAEQGAEFAAAAAAVKVAMQNLLTKKQYSVEKRELRKRHRNDKKAK